MNRLADETSPYLRQHRDNPVDWYPWGADAFAAAEQRNVPILLSVGYSACHWCHVMAHECFEDVEVAERMNELFVNVKVDREERPDVDAVYMDAVQALTGRGGWPMTVFMTPDRQPFYGGTYFPKPQFLALLNAVDDAFRNKPDELRQNIGALAKAIDTTASDRTSRRAARRDPPEHGGPGTGSRLRRRLGRVRPGPEVPVDVPPRVDAAGLHDQRRRGPTRHRGDDARRHGVGRDVRPHRWRLRPLLGRSRMARAALREDALRPGTARADVPARPRRHRPDATGARSLGETITYVLRQLRHPDGGFYSAEDADSPDADGHGVEGLFHTWTPDEARAAMADLPDDVQTSALDWFGITADGNFEGRSIPNRLDRTRRTRAATAHRSRTHGRCSPPANVAGVRARRQGAHRVERAVPVGTGRSGRRASVSRNGSTRRSPTASSCCANCAGRTGAGGGAGRPTVSRRRATTRSPPTTPPSSTPSRGSAEATGQARWITRGGGGRRHDARVVLGSGERRPLHDRRGRRGVDRPAEGSGRQRDAVGELHRGDRALPPRGPHR